MINYTRRNKVLCHLCFPVIKYFFNKPSSDCLVLCIGHALYRSYVTIKLCYSYIEILTLGPIIFIRRNQCYSCHPKIARHTRNPTINATTNPPIPSIMSMFEPLALFRIFLSNICLLFKDHSVRLRYKLIEALRIHCILRRTERIRCHSYMAKIIQLAMSRNIYNLEMTTEILLSNKGNHI